MLRSTPIWKKNEISGFTFLQTKTNTTILIAFVSKTGLTVPLWLEAVKMLKINL